VLYGDLIREPIFAFIAPVIEFIEIGVDVVSFKTPLIYNLVATSTEEPLKTNA
jgi:hypothetical protein